MNKIKVKLLTVSLVLCLTSLPAMARPLHDAAIEGNVAKIHTLLNQGAQVNARDKHGITPLHSAAKEGHVEAIRVLLKAGADVNAKSQRGCSPVDYARARMERTVGSMALFKIEETIKVLQAAGGRPGC